MQAEVILVDEKDNVTGTAEKMSAHENGWLHRAFSVFVFTSDGELLLQKRSADKYHSAGLWTNTCCSHPEPGRETIDAARERLAFEMGLECELRPVFSFTYCEKLDNGLTEHEFDHVFIGISDEIPVLNTDEADAWKRISVDELTAELEYEPSRYTRWLCICWPMLLPYLKKEEGLAAGR